MPIYLYVCNHCAHELEALQKISDDPLVHCPSCGQAALHKQVTAAAFRLKGTGWYETDFKHSGKETKGAKTPDAKPSEDSAAKSDGPTVAKRANKKVSAGTEGE